MRLILCFTLLMILALTLLSEMRAANGCTDWDQDWVCSASDCNDSNPTIGYDGDVDGDGFTVCEGDCDDADPSIHKCGEIRRMYPIIYQPPELCTEPYQVTTKVFNCWIIGNTKICDPEPLYQYDNIYFRYC